MQNRFAVIVILLFVLLLIDTYVFQAVRTVSRSLADDKRNLVYTIYWSITALAIGSFLFFTFFNTLESVRGVRTFVTVTFSLIYFSKLFIVLFLFADDLIRLGQWVVSLFAGKTTAAATTQGITRSVFLNKMALIAGALPFSGLVYGIIKGAHDYKVRKVKLVLPTLPKGFEGMTIAQISDVHSGSFWNKEAVMRGVNLLMQQKPEMVFFTGDLVNNIATEFDDFEEVFNKIKAPMGVFSILGNHDYGDYAAWETPEAKHKNLQALIQHHINVGWDILLDEHRILERNGDKIALLGIQNWGTGRFPKYGSMEKAMKGLPPVPVNLLLSHDPSHWDAEVRPKYPFVDAMFSGHTHGMQFGIRIPGFKWSPVQYRYKQWGGLYKEGRQQLYVNTGFGYIGYPGRLGMPPEITLFTLARA